MESLLTMFCVPKVSIFDVGFVPLLCELLISSGPGVIVMCDVFLPLCEFRRHGNPAFHL